MASSWNAARMAAALRWIAGALIVVYGIIAWDRDSAAWAMLSLAAFSAPLLLQLTPWKLVRAYALWVGLFLVVQALLTPALRGNLVKLPANMRSTVLLKTPGLPGMPPGLRHVTTDERGFRVKPPVDYGSRRGVRVFAIGGSTTEDILLDDASTWTHLLQDGLARHGRVYEVVNTGVSGLRAVNHLATFEYVADLKPDLVVFLLGANDWNKHIRDHFEPGRDSWTPTPMRLSVVGALFDRHVVSPLRRRTSGRAWFDVATVIAGPDALPPKEQLAARRSVQYAFRPERVLPAYSNTLDAISRACKAAGTRCLFISQPHAYDTDTYSPMRARFWMTPPYAKYTLDAESMRHIAAMYNAHLRSFAAREGHPFCDLASEMKPSEDLYYDDMHYTDVGAQRVAEVVLPCVLQSLGPTAGG